MWGPPMKPLVFNLPALRLACATAAFALCGYAAAAASLEPLPEDPTVTSQIVDGSVKITQKREQNAVTSVRVQRGNNTYYVSPSEYNSAMDNSVRGAQWEIFQFRNKPAPDTQPSAPPPPR